MSADIVDIRDARLQRFRSGPPAKQRSRLEREAFAAFYPDEDGPQPPRAA